MSHPTTLVLTNRCVDPLNPPFQVPEPAPLVTIPFRAFLHNLTVEDQLSTLAACHRALRPGGRLVLNVFNPSLPLITRWMARGPRHWEPYGGARKPDGERAGDDGTQARNEYRPTAQAVTTHIRVRDAATGRWRKASFRSRYVYRFEMEHLLQRAGFEVESLAGDFSGGAFEEASTEMVWVARRPPRRSRQATTL